MQKLNNGVNCQQRACRGMGYGGGRGIRTPGAIAGTAVFKTAALNHSTIPPDGSATYKIHHFGIMSSGEGALMGVLSGGGEG